MMMLPRSKKKLKPRKTLAPEKRNTSTSSSAMSGPRMGLTFRYRSSTRKVRADNNKKVHGSLVSFSRPMYTLGIASLAQLMRDFSTHHKGTAPPPGFAPRAGDLVAAKFSDGAWYRAKIRRASPVKREAEVTFIDYGNQDTIGFADMRPLDAKFRKLPGQARDARLRCAV
jgi:Tudor domain